MRYPRELLESLSREVLSEQSPLYFSVRGGSMWPLIRNGDRVLLRRVREEQLERGDIFCFSTPRRWVVHRLIARLREARGEVRLLTRGDANWCSFESTAPDQVQGRVVAIRRAGRERRLGSPTDRLTGAFCTILSMVLWRVHPSLRSG